MDTTTTKTLARNIECTSIHAVTLLPYEEGTLEAGALVRGIQRHHLGPDETKTTFEASTDGGTSWYRQETYEAVEVE